MPYNNPLAEVNRSRAAVIATFDEILEWDMVERGIRHLIILRQIELYDQPVGKMTHYEWSCAKQRSAKFMPLLASWLTVLWKYDDSLQRLSGSLNKVIHSGDLSPLECQLLSECRTIIKEMRLDLDLACKVLENHQSFVPTRTENYDPDFAADWLRLETLLVTCERQIAKGLRRR